MIALIAGRGALPGCLDAALRAAGQRPVITALEGQPPDGPAPDVTFRLERLGSFLDSLRARGVTAICLAGAIDRPQLDPAAVDAATTRMVPVFMAALAQGDDGALRAVLGLIEEAGFAVLAAHEICPELLPPVGCLAGPDPDEALAATAARGDAVIAAMGAADVGQACIVRGQAVLAVEATPGTDFMLASLRALPEGERAGAVLCKTAKPGQDLRADMPAIGPGTVAAAQAAGLTAIVIGAGRVMVLERAETLAAAETAGITLWVRDAEA